MSAEVPNLTEITTPRLCVMISGGGRSLQNLIEHIRLGTLRAEVPLVIASRDCPGVELARSLGVPDVRVIRGEIPAKELAAILRALPGSSSKPIDWIVLAGYLRFVHVPIEYQGRIVNIHPALLPKFGGPGMYGHHVHEAVLRAGEKTSGCTVHLVDERFDHGPIVLQRSCSVLPADTAGTLAARVFELECEAYPAALRQLFGQ